MSIYIKDMDMPVDCLGCRISCKHESYMVIGRPEDCPLEEAKDGDLISRADAIEAVAGAIWHYPNQCYKDLNVYEFAEALAKDALSAIPSADADRPKVVGIDYSPYRIQTTAPSADATCATCADRALCIMSAPDGNWKACKDYKPSAEAAQGWIPCSERLPDVDVEVLTTTDWSEVLIAWYRKDGTWETDEYILANDEILAWMPLPTPYKGGDSE